MNTVFDRLSAHALISAHPLISWLPSNMDYIYLLSQLGYSTNLHFAYETKQAQDAKIVLISRVIITILQSSNLFPDNVQLSL